MRVKASRLLPFLLVLFLFQAWMQSVRIFPYWGKHYSPRQDSDLSSLTPDQLLAAMAGFREMIAGILWVKADTYFNEGNYDAILPMVRIVTMLDSKQLDVYTTGIWHIAYNFTDEAQRSDRRYIIPAIALGKEGSRLNDYTYEITYETGWLWYHKVDDEYDQAVKYFEKATEYDIDTLYKQYKEMGLSDFQASYRSQINGIPEARKNLLAQTYLRNGQVDKALEHLATLYEKADEVAGSETFGPKSQARDTVELNLDSHLVRMAQRGVFATKRGDTDLTGYDVFPPFDTGFSASVTVIEPKVLLVEGTWNVLPVGCRIRLILRDKDFPQAVPGGMVWDRGEKVDFSIPPDQTFLQDQLFVKNQRFSRKVDMSRDVTMYPLASNSYVLEFYYNPRSAPPHIQDKFGFNGEGMTDANFLRTDVRDGQRVVYSQLEIPKDMILLRGDYRRGQKPAVVTTKNYEQSKKLGSSSSLIQVPGLRSGG